MDDQDVMTVIADTSVFGPPVDNAALVRRPRVTVVGNPTRANDELVGAWLAAGIDAAVVTPTVALATLEPGDVALFRLDVLPTLDGVEPGFDAAATLEARGVRVLNCPQALLAAHDKLLTSAALAAAGLRQPWTIHVTRDHRPTPLPLPCVLKPRFGSWGADVMLCRTSEELERVLEVISPRQWWARHGALVQELVPPTGRDLRLLVAGGRVVGSAARIAAAGEWRTNVSVGGHLELAEPPPEAVAEAEAAARTLAIDLAGVDLLPWDGGWVVLEVNGAIDFDGRYALPGHDMYREIAELLGLPFVLPPTSAEARAPTLDRPGRWLPAHVGDVIEIAGPAVGGRPRSAEILAVGGEPGQEHFRVRWADDGHESVYIPGADARIVRSEA